jgi:hypothetical protein
MTGIGIVRDAAEVDFRTLLDCEVQLVLKGSGQTLNGTITSLTYVDGRSFVLHQGDNAAWPELAVEPDTVASVAVLRRPAGTT